MKEYGFNTTLLHGTEETNPFGATQVPVYQSSAFRHDTAEELEKIFANKRAGYSYTRINNPTVEAFEKRMTKLEGGIGSVACASGMAALTMALMNILQNGDHVVAAAGLYGGTVELLDEMKAYGLRQLMYERIHHRLLKRRLHLRPKLFLQKQLAIRNWM